LRKYLIAALAACIAVGLVAMSASAQSGSGVDLKVNLKPSKAGTKKKPKSTKIHFVTTNQDVTQTAEGIKIWIPKTLKISNKGFPKCKASVLEDQAQGPDACPKGSEVGGGTALARAGVNVIQGPISPTNPPQLPFDVRAFVTGKSSLAFHIRSTQPGIEIVAITPAKLKKASGKYGQVLDVTIPREPAQFYLGQYNGLEQLDVTIGDKFKKKNLIVSTGCNKKKAPFKTEIAFAPNPGPPKAETLSDTDNAKCSK
jgi:hypothetical protein